LHVEPVAPRALHIADKYASIWAAAAGLAPGAPGFQLDDNAKFKDVPLAIEFRNRQWSVHETFEFLSKNKIANCVVDEPKLPRLMPFVNETTSDISYIRLHGRNKNWFNTTREERYDYLYNDDELSEFIPEIKKAEKGSKKTYVYFNNCHAGSAIKNALKLKKMLGFDTRAGKLF